MQQPDLFTGEQLRDAGIAAAEHDRTLVIQAVDKAIELLASMMRSEGFTAGDVRMMLGRHVRDLEDVSKVIGGRIRAAAVRGEIYTDGKTVKTLRAPAHSRRVLVWYAKETA
jgi:hypothetical protein